MRQEGLGKLFVETPFYLQSVLYIQQIGGGFGAMAWGRVMSLVGRGGIITTN
jgi:hypothetical protein